MNVSRKAKRTYELESEVDASVAIASIKLGRDISQVVEDILRKDPLIAEILARHYAEEPLPDYDPKRGEKIPA